VIVPNVDTIIERPLETGDETMTQNQPPLDGGSPLPRTTEAPATPPTDYPGAPPGAPTVQEIRAFVGRGAEYYLNEWTPALQNRGQATGFNVAALLLSGLWLPYRKLYKVATIFFGIILAPSVLEEILPASQPAIQNAVAVFGWVVAVTAWIVCGAFGNRWLLSRARRVIAEVRSCGLGEAEHLDMISKRGGTNTAASVGMFFMFLVSIVVILTVIEIASEMEAMGERLTFNGGEVYYKEPVTEQQARGFGELLVQDGYFDGRAKTVLLGKRGGRYQLRMVIVKGFEHDSMLVQFARKLGAELSEKILNGEPVDVHLCDEYLDELRVIRDTGHNDGDICRSCPSPVGSGVAAIG